jgi:hypothetical protein
VQLQAMVRRRGSRRRREAESESNRRETERERAEGLRESGETERELRLDGDEDWGLTSARRWKWRRTHGRHWFGSVWVSGFSVSGLWRRTHELRSKDLRFFSF